MQTPNKKFKLSTSCTSIDSPIASSNIRLEDDLSCDSPRPLSHVINRQKHFKTKKQNWTPFNLSTSRLQPQRIHPSMNKSRLSSSFHAFESDRRPSLISFKVDQSNTLDESKFNLSKLYDENNKELFFKQCFDIKDRIGSGSFADVFKVVSKDDGQPYAIKVTRDKFRGDKDRKRKLHEVLKHETLPEHPHLVRFYRAWEERQRLFIQTELCLMSLSEYAEINHDIDELTTKKGDD